MSDMTGLPQAYGVADCAVKKVAVIGAGAMGAGIAAQFANAGVPVDLLDIAGPDEDRNGPAKSGVARQLKAGGFMHANAAGLVRTGNTEDHLDRLADADWIIEAVIENIGIKKDLYGRIAGIKKAGAIVSSNTSTILRADLMDGLDPDFAADFVISHFFNPPRMMRLVELVTTPEIHPALVEKAKEACETILGKTVVECRDTPGFIANRIGCLWIAAGILEAKRLGLTPEEADGIMTVFGIPRTGVFGLIDLVGVDLVPHVWGSLMGSLPDQDVLHQYDLPDDPTIEMLIETGRFGRKTKAGFSRMGPDKKLEILDFATGEYRAAQPIDLKALPGGGRDLAALVQAEGKYAAYARHVLAAILAYSATHGPEIAADVEAIDAAMELGYGWKKGPFRIADSLGLETVAEIIEREGREVPDLLGRAMSVGAFYDGEGEPLTTDGTALAVEHDHLLSLAAVKRHSHPIIANDAASLWDIGDGVACLEIHTKLNSLAPEVFDILAETIARGGKDYQALVLGNDDVRAFSAGADLSAILGFITENRLDELSAYIARGQDLFRQLRFSPFPVVAAMHGLALGGGCEIGLHADRIVAHAELNAGLPEVLVGLVPGWGGCTRLLVNAQTRSGGMKGPVAVPQKAFQTIFTGKRSSSALDARESGILRPDDVIVMNRNQLLAAAKQVARDMLDAGYQAPEEVALRLPGKSGMSAIMVNIHGERAAGRLTDTDVAMAEALSEVLTGGPDADVSQPLLEADIMRLEREALVRLAGRETTRARIEHMLKTGKPLRN